jgi:hypothetical protein
MNPENTQLTYAIVAAIIFFTVREGIRAWQTRPARPEPKAGDPSPSWGVRIVAWLRAHMERDREPEHEPDPPNLTQDHEWGSIDYTESHGRRHTVRDKVLPRPVIPPAKPKALAPAKPGPRPPEKLDVWVAASLDNGASQTQIRREGMSKFGVSDSTVRRSIKRALREHV